MYGHVLKTDKNNYLRRVLDFKAKGTIKRSRPMKTKLRVVIEKSRNVGLNVNDVNNRS